MLLKWIFSLDLYDAYYHSIQIYSEQIFWTFLF